MNILKTYEANGRCVSILELRPKGKKGEVQTLTWGVYLDKKQYIKCIRKPHAMAIFEYMKEELSKIPRKNL